MSIILTVKGVPYTFPQDGDTDYGSQATACIQAMAAATNNTPDLNKSVEWDAVVGTDPATRTHASLAAVIADANIVDGMCVAVQEGVYSLAAMTNITKRLFIQGVGTGCVFTATAGIATGSILKFSAAGTILKDVVVDAGAGTPQHAIEVNAVSCGCDILASGSYSSTTMLFTSGLSTFGGLVRDTTGVTLYGTAAGGANQNLSNLLSPTSINQSLIPSADNTFDLGASTPKTWKKAYIGEITSTTIGATTGNITTGNITTGNIGTANITKLVGTQINIPVLDINWASGLVFYQTINSATTYTFSNNADGMVINIVIVSSGTGAITWPAGIKWPGGAAPTQTQVGTDVYTLMQVNSVMYGFQAIGMA